MPKKSKPRSFFAGKGKHSRTRVEDNPNACFDCPPHLANDCVIVDPNECIRVINALKALNQKSGGEENNVN